MSNVIDVVMRSKNEGHYVRQTIEAVRRQRGPWTARITVIDSGSTDGSLEIFRELKVERLIEIQRYVAGTVLNQGMRETSGEWVVFLNADATPANEEWLVNLIAAAQAAPRTGTAFSRQIPRPDCRAVYAHDYDRCFGLARESVNWGHFFSMVSSIVYRPAWEAIPFRDDLTYAEDDEWSRRLVAAGWSAPYADTSVAIHSHNYTVRQAYKRTFGDSFANAATHPGGRAWWRDMVFGVVLPTAADAVRDGAWCFRSGRLLGWPHSVVVRAAQRLGKTIGFRRGLAHFHPAAPKK